jgi:hypothetical protein
VVGETWHPLCLRRLPHGEGNEADQEKGGAKKKDWKPELANLVQSKKGGVKKKDFEPGRIPRKEVYD